MTDTPIRERFLTGPGSMRALEPATPQFSYTHPTPEVPLHTKLKPHLSRRVIVEDGAVSDTDSDHHYSPCLGHKVSSAIPKFDSTLVGNCSDRPIVDLAKRMIPDQIFQEIAREDRSSFHSLVTKIIDEDPIFIDTLTHTMLDHASPAEPSAEDEPDIKTDLSAKIAAFMTDTFEQWICPSMTSITQRLVSDSLKHHFEDLKLLTNPPTITEDDGLNESFVHTMKALISTMKMYGRAKQFIATLDEKSVNSVETTSDSDFIEMLKKQENQATQRTNIAKGLDTILNECVRHVFTFIRRPMPSTTIKTSQPLKLPNETGQTPKVPTAKLIYEAAMKYFSQNPRDYFLLTMMMYYIHTSQLRKDVLIRSPEISELGTTGSGTAITINDAFLKEIFIQQSTTLAAELDRSNAQLCRQLGRGERKFGESQNNPIMIFAGRNDGMAILCSMYFAHAERGAYHKISLRSRVEHAAVLFSEGSVSKVIQLLLPTIDECISMKVTVSYDLVVQQACIILVGRSAVFQPLMLKYVSAATDSMRLDPMRTFYDFLIETDSLVRQTNIHTPPANHTTDKSRFGRAQVMFGENESADDDASSSGTAKNATGDQPICQKHGCNNALSKYMTTRIAKILEKGKKVNSSMNLCTSCYKDWTQVTGTELKLKNGKTITSKEPKKKGKVQQITTQEGDSETTQDDNSDDEAYLQKLKKALKNKSSSSAASARLSQADMESKSPAEIESEIRMFTERLRNIKSQTTGEHLNN